MKRGLLHTKIRRFPVALDMVPRERLLSKLDKGKSLPLTLISAAAGYGKSSLASQWGASCGRPCGWVSLDEDDSDLQLFLAYILAAIQQIFPNARLSTEVFLEANSLPPSAELSCYLLNDLDGLPESFILILDDYHRIAGKAVHDFVAALLEHPARTMHLVLLTRTHPPLPIAAMRGSGLLTEIGTEDLRFATDEVSAFMDKMFNATVDDGTAAVLETKTEGWAVGLRLVGLYLKEEKDLKNLSHQLSGSSKYITEYLFDEVILRLPSEILNYLIETSILDRFCAPLCKQLHKFGNIAPGPETKTSAEDYIQLLSKNNLFIIPLDSEGKWFRFHHLFQDFLKGLLHKKYNGNQIAEMHTIASNWFSENNLIEEAIEHMLTAGATSEAVKLVIDHRHALLADAQYSRLNRWLSVLPQKVFTDNPLLNTTKAFVAIDIGKNVDIYASTLEARKILETEQIDSQTRSILKGEVCLLEGLTNMFKGNAEQGLSLSREAFDLIPENAGAIHSLCLMSICLCHQMLGDTKQAVLLNHEALSNYANTANMKAKFHQSSCYVHFLNANLEGVKHSAMKGIKLLEGLPFYHTRAYIEYFLGLTLYLKNDLKRAQTVLQKVLDSRYTANPTYVAEAGLLMACCRLSLMDEDGAMRVLENIKEYCQKENHGRGEDILHAFDVEFALYQGKIKQACSMAKAVNFEIRPPRWFFYVPQLTYIKCLIAGGSDAGMNEAETLLLSLDEQMRLIHRINVRIEVLILLTVLHHIRKEDAAAIKSLTVAIALAKPGGWIRSFVYAGPPMVAMVDHFLKNNPDHTFAKSILEACDTKNCTQKTTKLEENRKSGIFRQVPNDILTRRETEILPFLAEGLSNKEVAGIFSITEGTVKVHLKNIFRKLNVTNRIEAVNKARRMEIYSPK